MVIKWSATAKPAAMSCLRRPVRRRASMAASARTSSHVMPAAACAMAGIYGC